MKLPIALQLFSVRDFARNDVESTLKEVKKYGYDGVELAGLYGKTPEEFKKMLDEIGLIPISAHVGYNEMCADMAKVISDYKVVGCKYLAVPWLDPEDRIESETGAKTLENIKRFADMAEEAGMALCYHNHEFEFAEIDGEYIFDILYKKISNLFVEQDSCWVASSGVSPDEYLKKYSGRTPLLHLKDYVGKKIDGDFEFRPLGDGVQNFESMIKTAEDTEVEWLIVEQDSPSIGLSSLECAKKSIDYLKRV